MKAFAVLIGLVLATISQQSEAAQCRANDLLVYNMALAQVQASSFRKQKPVYIQTPEKVQHHRVMGSNGQPQYLVSLNVFAIANPAVLSPESFQKRLATASGNDFVRIYFNVASAPGQIPCTNLTPAKVDLTQTSTLSWLDIPVPKNIVRNI